MHVARIIPTLRGRPAGRGSIQLGCCGRDFSHAATGELSGKVLSHNQGNLLGEAFAGAGGIKEKGGETVECSCLMEDTRDLLHEGCDARMRDKHGHDGTTKRFHGTRGDGAISHSETQSGD